MCSFSILSRSQAGLRLARAPSPDWSEIIGVLDANVRLAKRAGDILARLRAYVSNSGPAPEPASLNELVGNIAELMQSDLERRRIALELDLDPADPVCVVDRVSVEQVVHNLVRNAADELKTLGCSALGDASAAASWCKFTVIAANTNNSNSCDGSNVTSWKIAELR